MQPNHGTSIQFLTPPGGNLHSVFCPLDSWQLYLDNQEEVPSFPGAASGPPETQSLDESAPSGSVRGTRLLPLKDRCPTPWGSLCCHCPAPSLLWVGACPTPGPQLFLLQVLPPILATEPPSLTPVTRKPSPLGLSCPWFCASVSPGLNAQNAFGSLFLSPFSGGIGALLLPVSRPPLLLQSPVSSALASQPFLNLHPIPSTGLLLPTLQPKRQLIERCPLYPEQVLRAPPDIHPANRCDQETGPWVGIWCANSSGPICLCLSPLLRNIWRITSTAS